MNLYSEITAVNGKKLVVNPDARIIGNIVKMCLTRTNGYCPCNPAIDDDHICPCKEARENAHCCCHLYVEEAE